MNRWSSLVWLIVIAGAAFMLYMAKYQVQSIKTQVVETAKQLEKERRALHVVAAEWAYLNRPERLQALAAKYLSASGVTVEQVAEVEAIPFPRQLEAMEDGDAGIKPAALKMASMKAVASKPLKPAGGGR